jgi:hypothetical protein
MSDTTTPTLAELREALTRPLVNNLCLLEPNQPRRTGGNWGAW